MPPDVAPTGGAPASAPAPVSAPPSTESAPASAPQGDTPAPATPAEVRKLKVKLAGGEQEVPESEVIARYQKEHVAEKKFEEAARLHKQAEALVVALQNGDPAPLLKLPKESRQKLLRSLAKTDPESAQAIEEYIIEELRYEKMTPAQREAHENKLRLQEYEEQRAQQEKQTKDEERRRRNEYFNQNIPLALKDAGIAATPYAQSRMAFHIQRALKAGENITWQQATDRVREEYAQEETGRYEALEGDHLVGHLKKLKLAALSPEHLEALLGEEAVGRFQKHLVTKFKPKTPAVTPPRDPGGRFQSKEQQRPKTIEQFRQELEERKAKR